MKQFAILFLSIFFIVLYPNETSGQQKIKVQGIVLDLFDNPIPFAAVTIIGKSKGTSSTEDGEFSLYVTNNELEDVLSFS